jgi:YYY domain-containing protein
MQFTELLLWYFWMQAYAIGGSLVARAWLRNLPDRGYGIGKAAGLLLGGFFYWITVTLGWSSNTTGAALLGLAAVWVLGFAVNGGRLTEDREQKTEEGSPSSVRRPQSSVGRLLPSVLRSPAIVITEILFAVAYVGWAYVRAYTPEILESGGEKFMEIMMINAIVRAPGFPPNDAWLTGFPISYYYFGYILFAMLIKVSGVAPSIAFNLGGAMFFALAFVGAFSVGWNVWASRESRVPNPQPRANDTQRSGLRTQYSALKLSVAGLLAALMLTLMGNMGGLMGALRCSNALSPSTWEWLDIREIAQRQETCNGIAPAGWFPWWWDWSRVVKDYSVTGGEQEIITEAPIFSYVLGDNHPHTLALPFIMLAVGIALSQFLYKGYANEDYKLTATTFVLNAIAIGSIGFLNTIDLPIVALTFLTARLLARYLYRESLLLPALTGVLTLAVGYALYLPFHVTLKSQVQGIMPNLFNGTRFVQFFMMFAPMALAAVGLIAVSARDARIAPRVLGARSLKLILTVLAASVLAVALFGALSSEARALVQEFQTAGGALGATREQITARAIERVTSPWTALFLAAVIAISVAVVRRQTAEDGERAAADIAQHTVRSGANVDAFALALLVIGALVVLAIEFVFVRDFFGTRLNSVFKFWYQAWTVWSVMSAYALMRLLTSSSLPAKIGGAVVALFVAAGLLWPVMAIPAKWAFSRGFNNTLPALDGAAYLKGGHPGDSAVINWIYANVSGAPVVLEVPHNGSYNYNGRISAFTGLPAPLGWAFHEYQWRGSLTEQDRRRIDIDTLFSTIDINEAQALLQKYKIEYVVIGPPERSLGDDGVGYPEEGLSKFATLCKQAFVSGETTLYRCAAK